MVEGSFKINYFSQKWHDYPQEKKSNDYKKDCSSYWQDPFSFLVVLVPVINRPDYHQCNNITKFDTVKVYYWARWTDIYHKAKQKKTDKYEQEPIDNMHDNIIIVFH